TAHSRWGRAVANGVPVPAGRSVEGRGRMPRVRAHSLAESRSPPATPAVRAEGRATRRLGGSAQARAGDAARAPAGGYAPRRTPGAVTAGNAEGAPAPARSREAATVRLRRSSRSRAPPPDRR